MMRNIGPLRCAYLAPFELVAMAPLVVGHGHHRHRGRAFLDQHHQCHQRIDFAGISIEFMEFVGFIEVIVKPALTPDP